MRKRSEGGLETPIASLIDVVFLLIIFFVVTAAVEKDVVDESIRLAQAKYVRAVDKKDPRTVVINLREDGRVNIAMQFMTLNQLRQILVATVARSGNQVPIVIRSHKDTLYNEVDSVMQVIGDARLYRVKLAAVSVD
jgi:biopolymer transport protein ExbD